MDSISSHPAMQPGQQAGFGERLRSSKALLPTVAVLGVTTLALAAALVSGHITLEDAQGMGAQLKEGQPFHQDLVLCLVEKGTEYTPESRKYFSTMRGSFQRMATIVDSAVLRAMINFMHRVTGNAADFRVFNSEPEALSWLDAD